MPSPERLAELERFRPTDVTSSQKIDYAVIDEFLDLTVIDLGPSTRTRERRPRAPIGSRISRGHDSPIRLEGNKVVFSEFNEEVRTAAREYAASLEAIGNGMEITWLSRNEQLSYWFNLHNITLMATLAERYPVVQPSNLRIDGVLLHDAPLVTIDGVSLSLRDIREQIVYKNWSDPRVLYGFWYGDLGGPSILTRAWSPSRLDSDLNKNAEEFINSLRGVDAVGSDSLGVSELYRSARGALFEDWPLDLKAHLLAFAEEEVTNLVRERSDIEWLPYDKTISDLSAGQPYGGPRPGVEALSGGDLSSGSPQRNRMLREMLYKFDDPDYWTRRRATVTIIDGPVGALDDEDEPVAEIE